MRIAKRRTGRARVSPSPSDAMAYPTEQVVVLEAQRRGLQPYSHTPTGNVMIDGLRWDLWWKYRNTEVSQFRGIRIVKEM